MQNTNKWFGLQNRSVVVLGAGGLIGAAVTQALYDCGAEVIAVDREFNRECAGRRVTLDLTQESQMRAFFAGLKHEFAESPREVCLVNCSYPRTAAWGKMGFDDFTLEEWNTNFQMHLGSTFLSTQLFTQWARERGGGALVNFGSIYGVVGPDLSIYDGTPMKNPVAYHAIKGGVVALTRYVATVFGKNHVRANVVCPGGIWDHQPASFVSAYEKKTPLGRMGAPDDIAGVVAFLLAPASKYVTGQVIMADGGWSAW